MLLPPYSPNLAHGFPMPTNKYWYVLYRYIIIAKIYTLNLVSVCCNLKRYPHFCLTFGSNLGDHTCPIVITMNNHVKGLRVLDDMVIIR